jgi:ABC-type transport system substrate-binding protein
VGTPQSLCGAAHGIGSIPGPRHFPGAPGLPLLFLVASATLHCRKEVVEAPRTVAIAAPYELDTLDPQAEDRLSNFAILFNVYDPLEDTDADMRIRPSLATTWESPDPLTWVFHVRSSVTFHSGRPLRAADVVYSLKRPGREAGLQVSNFTRDIADVEPLDDHTIKLRTAVPTRVLLAKLRHVAIIPEGATAGAL